MAEPRSYNQYCALARALDLVGERWTPLIVRELTIGPRRFTDLVDGLPGIGRSLLSARLRHLVELGVARRRELPPPAASTAYELTELGEELAEALLPLQRWGRRFLGERGPAEHLHANWYLIHFRRGLHAERAAGVHESYEFRFPDEVWHLRVDDGEFDLQPGPARDPAVVVTVDLDAFAALGLGRMTAAEAIESGRFRAEGEPDAVKRSVAICGLLDEWEPAAIPAT